MPSKTVTDEEYDRAVRRIARDAHARDPTRLDAAFVVSEIEAFCEGSDVCVLGMWHDAHHAYGGLANGHGLASTATGRASRPAVLVGAAVAVAGVVGLARAWSHGTIQRAFARLARGRQ